jgi:hypothetical protein
LLDLVLGYLCLVLGFLDRWGDSLYQILGSLDYALLRFLDLSRILVNVPLEVLYVALELVLDQLVNLVLKGLYLFGQLLAYYNYVLYRVLKVSDISQTNKVRYYKAGDR